MSSDMALILPPGYAQLVLGFADPNCVSGRMAIVLGYGSALGDDPTSLQQFTANVADLASTMVPALFDIGITLDSIYAQTENSSYERPVDFTGARALTMAPPNVAVLVKYGTTGKGRRARGRSFLHGVVDEDQIDESGTMAQSAADAVSGPWLGFLEDLEEAADPAVNQVILQSTSKTGPDAPANPTPPLSPPPAVINRTVDLKVATQRRRLRK